MANFSKKISISFPGMRSSLPLLLSVFVAALYYHAGANRFNTARYQLGKALLRRAREINDTQSNGDEALEPASNDMSEEERERVQQIDATEDIFVGSGSHVYESQGKSENSDSRGEETSGNDEAEAEQTDSSPTSGDGNEGEEDDDEEEKSDDDEDDVTEKKSEKESVEDEDSSGSGLIENENAARRSMDESSSGSGIEQQDDDNDQSESEESTIQETEPSSGSREEASGAQQEMNDVVASKKSEIEDASSGDNEDESEESGSAEVIRKGIESLSRLLTPVASGYDFELYSGNAPKDDKEKETEAEGESEESNDEQEIHVKKCKRVCKDPMTYEQCAVPRCGYKMGTIKDLCIYLCKHQTPVCSEECE